jgi:hypothetical protein
MWKGRGVSPGAPGAPGPLAGVVPPLMVVLALIGLDVARQPLAAQGLRYSGSLQYATGSYVFDARSHSLYLTSGLTLDRGRFEASASMPIILQNGGVVSTVGDRLLPTGGEGHGTVAHRRSGDRIHIRRDEGMGPGEGTSPVDPAVRFSEAYRVRAGDPFARVGGELVSAPGHLRSVRVSAGAKIPATDLDGGVGTGEWDYTIGASATARVGPVFVLGDLSYWWLGDLPELELRDGLSYGLSGAVGVLADRGTLMASLSGAQRVVQTLDPPLSFGAALGYWLDGPWSVNGGLSVGLTESASDLSLFVGWSRRLDHGR